jgi:hypothetical protein
MRMLCPKPATKPAKPDPALETMINCFPRARPGRVCEREIRRPDNMIGADVVRERRDRIIPGVEGALTLEHRTSANV